MKYQIYRFAGVTGNSSQLSTTGYAYKIEDMAFDVEGVTIEQVDEAIDVALIPVNDDIATAQSTADSAASAASAAQSTANSASTAAAESIQYPIHVAHNPVSNQIAFDRPRIYGYHNAPLSGNIQIIYSNAKMITQKIYHNDAALPQTISGMTKIGGNYVPNVLNTIYINRCVDSTGNTSYFTYWITQAL